MKKVVLIGFAACYKTSVGKLLAGMLNAKFVDTDEEIERACNMTVQQIFEAHGEQYFRNKENELLAKLAKDDGPVVSCGGGSVTVSNFATLAEGSLVVWLTATAANIKRRLGSVGRPLFDGLDEQALAHFIDSRAPLYRRYADVTLSTDALTSEQVAETLYNLLQERLK